MPDYKQGKIYMIIDADGRIRYYGSTAQTLMERWWEHKSHFNSWKKNGSRPCAIYKYFDEYGIDNFRIELVEDYPCDNDEQLRMKEDEYICENECVNEQRAYTTYEEKLAQKRQYHQDHKIENNKARSSRYFEHKEEEQELHKEYYLNNAEKIKERSALRYEKNREAIAKQAAEKVVCECGREVSKGALTRHRKTAFHQAYLNLTI
jgi:hypothetical protein